MAGKIICLRKDCIGNLCDECQLLEFFDIEIGRNKKCRFYKKDKNYRKIKHIESMKPADDRPWDEILPDIDWDSLTARIFHSIDEKLKGKK